jgi:hypothetical protein
VTSEASVLSLQLRTLTDDLSPKITLQPWPDGSKNIVVDSKKAGTINLLRSGAVTFSVVSGHAQSHQILARVMTMIVVSCSKDAQQREAAAQLIVSMKEGDKGVEKKCTATIIAGPPPSQQRNSLSRQSSTAVTITDAISESQSVVAVDPNASSSSFFGTFSEVGSPNGSVSAKDCENPLSRDDGDRMSEPETSSTSSPTFIGAAGASELEQQGQQQSPGDRDIISGDGGDVAVADSSPPGTSSEEVPAIISLDSSASPNEGPAPAETESTEQPPIGPETPKDAASADLSPSADGPAITDGVPFAEGPVPSTA